MKPFVAPEKAACNLKLRGVALIDLLKKSPAERCISDISLSNSKQPCSHLQAQRRDKTRTEVQQPGLNCVRPETPDPSSSPDISEQIDSLPSLVSSPPTVQTGPAA
ncbi:cardiac phospholamban isoform X2 [Acanthopagrus latus]|uniref:cardiac phospholamban isoform X2 n=1 Tax=Acanthopagrus latus TaxID=8177 RepID=UPI00187D0507|nr:cardiac phospholamban isoform X2 [Acanthopagrus latus]